MKGVVYKKYNASVSIVEEGHPEDSNIPGEVLSASDDGDETEGVGRYQLAQAGLALVAVLITTLSQNSIFYGFQATAEEQLSVAHDDWHRNFYILNIAYNLGNMFSMFIMGYISDRWGRRPSIMLSALGLAVGALKTVAVGPLACYIYISLVFCEATIAVGVRNTSFILILELIGSDLRILSFSALSVIYSLGPLVMFVIMWLLPYWRHMVLAVHLPTLLFISYPFLLHESPRWLQVTGRTKQAHQLRKKIANWNGLLEPNPLQEKANGEEIQKEQSILGLLLTSSVLRKRLLISSWWYFTMPLMVYGMMIPTGIIMSSSWWWGIASLAGALLAPLAIRMLGRRPILTIGFLLSGICCVLAGIIPVERLVWQMTIRVIGISAIALAFVSANTCIAELLPTEVRGTGLGLCSMMTPISGTLAMLLPILGEYWSGVPFCVISASSLVAGALVLLVPETGGRALPDTLAQAIELCR